jgi:hypothetical protein
VVAVLLVVACTEERARRPGSAPAVLEPIADERERRAPHADLPWRWYEQFPSEGVSTTLEPVGLVDRADVAVVGDPRTYTAEQRPAGVTVTRASADGHEAWRAELDAPAPGSPVVLADPAVPTALYVAFPTEGRVDVARLHRDSGFVRFRAALRPGDDGSMGVQLGGHEGAPVVYAQRGDRRQLFWLDPETGAVRGQRTFEPGEVASSWTVEGLVPGVAINRGRFEARGGGHYDTGRIHATGAHRPRIGVGTAPEPRLATRLRRLDPSGAEVWSREVEASPFDDHVALVELEGLVALALFSGNSSGTVLAAHDRETGATLWTAAPYGIGPVAHSRYANRVWLAAVGGRVIVRGEESGGRYVSVFEASGAPVSTVVWRR